MGGSQKLHEFQRGTVIGCNLCNKTSREISSLWNIPQSIVSGIITDCERQQRNNEVVGHVKWQRGVSGCWGAWCAEFANFLQSQLLQSAKLHEAFRLDQEQMRRDFHGMGFHGRAATSKPYITECNANRQMQRCNARHHWTLEQWRRVFWSDESRFFFWQSDGRVWVWRLPEEQYLPDCIVPSLKFGGRGILVWGCFSGAWIGPLVPGFSVQPGRTE